MVTISFSKQYRHNLDRINHKLIARSIVNSNDIIKESDGLFDLTMDHFTDIANSTNPNGIFVVIPESKSNFLGISTTKGTSSIITLST